MKDLDAPRKSSHWASFRSRSRTPLFIAMGAGLLIIVAIFGSWGAGVFIDSFSTHPLKGEPIRIAVANAFSGPNAASGIAMLRGAQLLVDKINAEGGVHGHPLALQPFDDVRDAQQAERVAEQIGDSRDIVAVIGHGSST